MMLYENTDQTTAVSDANRADRIGFYCWGGPGTIRMIQVKYFDPRFDMESLMTCYDADYVARVQALFGVTDYWVTYSWGFADEVEAEDRRFIIDRLDNFKRLGIRVHAYIQGPNLVHADFPDKDWWARDERGRYITYYRGRRMTSIHHQEFVDYIVNKIEDTYTLGFDGIFMDNIQHGQLGVPLPAGQLPVVFTGDRSEAAQAAFRARTGHTIPHDLEADLDLTRAYLQFRMESNTAFISTVADAVHRGNMEFGTNFYDPKFDPSYIYAIDLQEKTAIQDYILFENHALPRDDGKKHNGYVEDLIIEQSIEKPVFVVSYHHGVGMAPQFTQNELDNLFSEAAQGNFNLCLKGGEFTTNGVWHCLYLDGLQQPRTDKQLHRQEVNQDVDILHTLLQLGAFRRFLKRFYNPLFTVAFEWRILRFLIRLAYDAVLK